MLLRTLKKYMDNLWDVKKDYSRYFKFIKPYMMLNQYIKYMIRINKTL